MSAPTQAEIDEASEHPYECRCKLCLMWWKVMGPEPDDEPDDFDAPAF